MIYSENFLRILSDLLLLTAIIKHRIFCTAILLSFFLFFLNGVGLGRVTEARLEICSQATVIRYNLNKPFK